MHSTKDLRVVSICDPAIDYVAMERGLDVYIKRRKWEDLRFLPGVEPMVFHVRRPDTETMQRFVQTQNTLTDMFREAFRYGVTRVEGFVDDNGVRHSDVVPDESVQLPGIRIKHMSDSMLYRFSPQDVEEIGSIAYWLGFLRRGSVATFQPPRLLLSALVATQSDRVAAAIDALQSSPKSPAQPEAGDTASGGEKATDATATA